MKAAGEEREKVEDAKRHAEAVREKATRKVQQLKKVRPGEAHEDARTGKTTYNGGTTSEAGVSSSDIS